MEVTNTGTSRGAVAGGLLAAAKTHYKALVFRAVNSLTDIGYNVSLSINKNRFPLCPNLQRPLT